MGRSTEYEKYVKVLTSVQVHMVRTGVFCGIYMSLHVSGHEIHLSNTAIQLSYYTPVVLSKQMN